MTIKEIIAENQVDNIEFAVWKDNGFHKYNSDCIPHFDYIDYCGATLYDLAEVTENEIILQCCPPSISDNDVRIDINTEYDFFDFDFYILNQQEYYNYEGCVPDIDEEPESTLLFVFEPNFLKKLTGGLNND